MITILMFFSQLMGYGDLGQQLVAAGQSIDNRAVITVDETTTEETTGKCAANGEATDFYGVLDLVSNTEIRDRAISNADAKIQVCLDKARKECEDAGGVFEITSEALSESTDEPLFGWALGGWRKDGHCRIRRKVKISGGTERGTYIAARIRKTVHYKCTMPKGDVEVGHVEVDTVD